MSIEAIKRLVAAVEAIPEEVEGWLPNALTDALIDARKAIAEAEKQEPESGFFSREAMHEHSDFHPQPKAEKQVTYTGNGSVGRENMIAPTGFFFQMQKAEQEPVAGKGKELSEKLKLCARNVAFVAAGKVDMSSAAMQEMFSLIDHVCVGIDSPSVAHLQPKADHIEQHLDMVEQEPTACGLCGEKKAFAGTCGGGRDDPRALCYTHSQTEQEPVAWTEDDMAYRPNGLPQEFIHHEVESPDDWSEWVCPKPEQYFMKCCDCGLVHEAQFRVAKYGEGDYCELVEDKDTQAQFRMRRRTDPQPEPAIDNQDLTIAYMSGFHDGKKKREWVGLTDDEMYKLWLKADEVNDRMAFGKAVQAKLKEKNTWSS